MACCPELGSSRSRRYPPRCRACRRRVPRSAGPPLVWSRWLTAHDLGESGRDHHRQALEEYDVAKARVERLSSEDDVHTLIATLADARYEIACVQALAAGADIPEPRTGCLFNPQHGPSVRDVVHTFSRTGTRKVPACAQCAVRVEAGEAPAARQVQVDGRTVPYWDAGSAYLLYLLHPPTSAVCTAMGVAATTPADR